MRNTSSCTPMTMQSPSASAYVFDSCAMLMNVPFVDRRSVSTKPLVVRRITVWSRLTLASSHTICSGMTSYRRATDEFQPARPPTSRWACCARWFIFEDRRCHGVPAA